MSFHYPVLFWGLFALIIPILIHFFNFRKYRIVEFSTIQFIQELKEETKRKKKIKHALILICRMLFLTFLIAAFAQPYVTADRPTGNTIIYLDNSLSMSNEVASGRKVLDEGIEYVAQLLTNMPLEERLFFFTNDFSSTWNQWQYKSAIDEQLTEVELAVTSRSIHDVLSRVPVLGGRQVVLYLSDFQKSTIDLESLEELEVDLNLIPIMPLSKSNVYIDTVFLDGPVMLDRSNILKVIVRNSGIAESGSYQIKLLNGNNLVSTLSFEFVDKRTIELDFTIATGEMRAPEFRLELIDFPVTFDNTYFFMLEPYQRPVITYLFEESVNSFIQKVYGNERLFDFGVNSATDIAYERISRSNLIILDGFREIPVGLQIPENCDVVIIPGQSIDVSSYSAFIGAEVRSMRDSLMRDLRIRDSQNPFFRNLFRSDVAKADFPKAQLQYRLVNSSNVLMETTFGESFLSISNQKNRMYFFATGIEPSMTNFPVHSLFLPVMYRIAYTSIQSSEALAYNLDQRVISFDLNVRQIVKQVTVIDSKQLEFIPEYSLTDNKIVIELPPITIEPGIFHLKSGEDTLKSFALNYARDESELTTYSIEELVAFSEKFEHLKVTELYDERTLKFATMEGYTDLRLWKYALLLALLFLLCESLLVRFYR